MNEQVERGTGTIQKIEIYYENGKEIYADINVGDMTFEPNKVEGGATRQDKVEGGSKKGGKKSRKPKSKRIRVRKTRRRKH